MIVLLPPSETKRGGGAGPPLSLDALSSPTLGPLRAALVDELVTLAGDRSACRRALGISASQDVEIDRNATLRSAATLPAVSRYTGVLYDALDVESLRGAAAGRARARLAINSALFGLLRADDPVPAYRLSATSKLPGQPSLAARWRPLLEPVLAELAANELVVDLRSGSYAAMGRMPGAVRVDVVAEHADGRRSVVSHSTRRTRDASLAPLPRQDRSPTTPLRWRASLGARECGWNVEATNCRFSSPLDRIGSVGPLHCLDGQHQRVGACAAVRRNPLVISRFRLLVERSFVGNRHQHDRVPVPRALDDARRLIGRREPRRRWKTSRNAAWYRW